MNVPCKSGGFVCSTIDLLSGIYISFNLLRFYWFLFSLEVSQLLNMFPIIGSELNTKNVSVSLEEVCF